MLFLKDLILYSKAIFQTISYNIHTNFLLLFYTLFKAFKYYIL